MTFPFPSMHVPPHTRVVEEELADADVALMALLDDIADAQLVELAFHSFQIVRLRGMGASQGHQQTLTRGTVWGLDDAGSSTQTATPHPGPPLKTRPHQEAEMIRFRFNLQILRF